MHLFLLGLALAASPGPDFLLMTKNTLTHGRSYGYLTLLGNRLSLVIHITFAFLGLSMVLKQSGMLFSCIKILGACYLVFLGFKGLTNKIKGEKINNQGVEERELTPGQAFRSGFFSNFLNPKVSLFFLSIFPQFANPDQLANHPLSVAALFFVGNSCWYIPVIFLIGFRKIRMVVQRFQRSLDYIFGLLFVFFGLSMIWEEILKAKHRLLDIFSRSIQVNIEIHTATLVGNDRGLGREPQV